MPPRAPVVRFADSGWPAIASLALLLAALLAAPVGLSGQQDAADRPAADPADVESPDAIVSAAYETISGPAGEERDWDRLRSLFVPDARLIPTDRQPDGTPSHQAMTVDEFVGFASRIFSEGGFHESEIHAVTERYADIAHVFSTYESRRDPDDAEPFQRGINSFQLWYDGDRWWIVTIFWHGERENAPIPERYGG